MNDNLIKANLLFQAVEVTELAAIAAFTERGKGDEKNADRVAVEAMRLALNKIDFQGQIVIGEGERDKAPMLHIAEKLGCGTNGLMIDIAVDPLEGTTILATDANGALSVLAFANKGSFLNAPDVYMDKIAIGFTNQPIIDLDNSIIENLDNVAKFLKKQVSEITVAILNRPRHQILIQNIRKQGARIKLINDGDIAAVILTTQISSGIDIYIGSGGAPEGVLAAAALQTLNGFMCARLLFNEQEATRAVKMGIKDLNKKYYLNDLAKGEIIFTATGVTNGDILDGVTINNNQIITHSVVMHSTSKTVRYITNKRLNPNLL